MRFVGFFTGVGGLDLGLEWAGMECVAQIENDDSCLKRLERRWPTVPRFKDIRDVSGSELPSAELVCGGFPCQPFSFAGKRKGAADDRHLWPEYFRLIKEIGPRWVVAENVPGIVNAELDTVLSDLEGEGYTTGTLNLPACAFDAPHIRYRIFVVAYADHAGCKEQRKRISNEEKYASVKCESQNVANAYSHQQYGWGGDVEMGREWFEKEVGTDDDGGGAQWCPEPGLGRVAYGVPNRVDRLRGLGNAVVPQVAEFIGRAIMDVEMQLASTEL